jgi:nicotinate phosphoribosyltransferase
MEFASLATFTDLYQLTMMYGYFLSGKSDTLATFDLYFRKQPFDNGYTIVAGLESAVDYLTTIHFTDEDIAYLQKLGIFKDDAFFDALRSFRFTGTVHAMPEGSIAFPDEPILRVTGRLFEAQLVETALLALIGYQCLVATKASRIVTAAQGKQVLEFGSRRAQAPDAALLGARAAVLGGCFATSNVLAGQRFGLRVAGTHAHSWVLSFSTELEAFQVYAHLFPDNLILLVDTYDTIQSGIPNAIQTFRDVFAWHGKPKLYGIRIDSGDLTYLSKTARTMLREAGFSDATIVASNDLDEYLIREIEAQGAQIDVYGVGTHLITAYDQPSLGSVYKLAAEWNAHDNEWQPKLKRSDNPDKITLPGIKKVVRFTDQDTRLAIVDLIMLEDEPLPVQPFTVFDPIYTWKRKRVEHADAENLLVPIIVDGQLQGALPSLDTIIQRRQHQLAAFSPEQTRLLNPHRYHVDLSERLWRLRLDLLNDSRR